jgi:hypothetical protein
VPLWLSGPVIARVGRSASSARCAFSEITGRSRASFAMRRPREFIMCFDDLGLVLMVPATPCWPQPRLRLGLPAHFLRALFEGIG